MKKQFGLTLIELLVSLAAVAILISLAVPAFRTFTASNKQSARINQLTAAFALARSEAVTRNAPVELKASDDTDWANGWTLSDVSSGDEIKVGPDLASNVTATASDLSVIFNADGTTSLNADMTVTICDSTLTEGDHGMKITLIKTGRYSVEKNVTCP